MEVKLNDDVVSRDDFDDLRDVTNILKNFCEGKKTLKRAMPVITSMSGLSEDRIKYIIKKYFKDGNYE